MKSFYIILLFYVPLFESTKSKLSIHAGMGHDSWRIVREGKPNVIKLLDAMGAAKEIKEAVPGPDPKKQAEDWWNKVKGSVLPNPDVDFWEGYNEVEPDCVDAMKWYSDFEIARIDILNQYNLSASLGNFAVGTPDLTKTEMIEAFIPAIEYGIKNNAILGFHEYNAPWMDCLFSGDVETGEGWLTGRYRKFYRQFLEPKGLKIPMFFSENGMDMGVCPATTTCRDPCPTGSNGEGWKSLCNFWSSKGKHDCPRAYMDELIWYDQMMQVDDYVLGSSVFSLEIPGWQDFDIAPLTDIFIEYLNNETIV